jgi:hypothetical protein
MSEWFILADLVYKPLDEEERRCIIRKYVKAPDIYNALLIAGREIASDGDRTGPREYWRYNIRLAEKVD